MGDYMAWLIVVAMTIAIGSVCIAMLALLVMFLKDAWRSR